MVVKGGLPDTRVGGLVIGSFDGLHVGHLEVLGVAHGLGVRSILTFYPIPKYVLSGVKHLTLLWEKLAGFSEMGFDRAYVVDFAKSDVRNMNAEEFLNVLTPLVDTLVVGYNFRFGRGRMGDVHMLKRWANRTGKKLVIVPPVRVDGMVVSSTRIRQCIARGELTGARRLLGYPYFASGAVVRGRGVGRRLGFPTVNIQVLDEKMMPPYGVYSGLLATDGGRVYWGVANWGLAPTFGRDVARLEVHVLREAFDENPRRALFVFHKFIRHEKKFNSIAELVKQVDNDLKTAMRMYSEEFVRNFYRAFLPSRVWKCMEEMDIG